MRTNQVDSLITATEMDFWATPSLGLEGLVYRINMLVVYDDHAAPYSHYKSDNLVLVLFISLYGEINSIVKRTGNTQRRIEFILTSSDSTTLENQGSENRLIWKSMIRLINIEKLVYLS